MTSRYTWLAILGLILPACLLAGTQDPSLRLPRPPGPHSVGRTTYFWSDSSRAKRPVRVDVWYPARGIAGETGPYFPGLTDLAKAPATGLTITNFFGTLVQPLIDGTVRSNVYDNVPVAQAGRPFPVLLFSHGLGNSPFIYAIQLEDLASHGYVIVATSHIGDAVAVVLPGGVSVPFAPWTSSDSSAAGVHRRLFVDDLVLALDQMTVLSRDAGSPFNGVLDLSRIGSFGHSIGGRAAVGACMKDSRIRACLNQDGGLHGPNEQGTSFPGTFAWLDWFDPGLDAEDYAAVGTTPYNYARDLLRPLETDLKIWRQHEGGSLRLTLLKKGMAHTAFTDMRWLTATSDASRARFLDYLTRIRQVTRAFFDQALYGRSSALLNCTPSESDLLVQCYRPEPTQKP